MKFQYRRYGAPVALASVVLLAAACSSSGSSGASSGSGGGGSGGSKAPYNIGLAAGVTGPAAAIVKGEIEGIKAAFSQVNAQGGIDGRKLNLVTSDTQNVATTAVAALTKLATENNVIASFGDILANNCQAQVPVAKARKIALLCGTLDPAQLQPPEPYVYTEYGSEVTEADAFVSIVKDKPLNLAHPKVAMVYVQSSSTVPMFNAIAAKIKADGGQVVLNDPIQAQLNLSVDASKVISSGANVVLEQIIPQQLQSLAQSLSNSGSKVPIVAEATTASYQQLVLLKNPNIYELSLNPFVDPTSSEPAVKDYVAALQQQGITGGQQHQRAVHRDHLRRGRGPDRRAQDLRRLVHQRDGEQRPGEGLAEPAGDQHRLLLHRQPGTTRRPRSSSTSTPRARTTPCNCATTCRPTPSPAAEVSHGTPDPHHHADPRRGLLPHRGRLRGHVPGHRGAELRPGCLLPARLAHLLQPDQRRVRPVGRPHRGHDRCGLAGALCYLTVFRPAGYNLLFVSLATVGLGTAIESAAALGWGSNLFEPKQLLPVHAHRLPGRSGSPTRRSSPSSWPSC